MRPAPLSSRSGSAAPFARMILAVALTALLPPAAPYAGELGWHILPNSPSADRHDDVQFLDPDLGWVVNRNGQVWKTTDGGETWELQLQISTLLRSVHFLDESLGFVGTINAAPDSLLYRTTNGGASWTNVVLPGPLPKGICGLIGVGDHVFASGAYFGNDRRFLHSTDRGATWTNYDLSPYLLNAIDCYFVSPDSGFVVGGKADGTINHPIILFTANGGQTWETRYYSNAFDGFGYCWKVFFVNPLAGFVSIQGHAILKTTDGGLTWVRKPVSTDTFIQGIGFATETIGWVDGSNPPSVTTDGGDTWNSTFFTGDPEFPWSSGNRFQMLSPSLGYCSGRRIYKFEPITTAVPVTLVTPTSRFHLTSYPNPAQGPATISYVLAEDGPVRVRVYTVLGRYLRTLHQGWQAAGGKTVLWPGDDDSGLQVGPGIYFYRVDAEGTAETARLVLVE